MIKTILGLLIVDIVYLGIKFMIFLGKRYPSDYFQTWAYVANLDAVNKNILRFLCGIIFKHPHSKTEWGYGGGKYADRWCRWCNKMFQVPKESVYFTNPSSKTLMKEVETIKETTNE
jgi:hypothetical protein